MVVCSEFVQECQQQGLAGKVVEDFFFCAFAWYLYRQSVHNASVAP